MSKELVCTDCDTPEHRAEMLWTIGHVGVTIENISGLSFRECREAGLRMHHGNGCNLPVFRSRKDGVLSEPIPFDDMQEERNPYAKRNRH